MYLTAETKKDIFKKHNTSETDTGSAEGQIALFSQRVDYLTGHLEKNKKDLVTQRSLVLLVGKRKRLLDYLKRKNIERYREIIKKLNIRK